MMLSKILVAGALAGIIAHAQQPQTRTQEIEDAREAKASSLAPEQPGRLERFLIQFKDEKLMERFAAGIGGFNVKVGGMPTGSGFALSPSYSRQEIARSRFSIDALAGYSSRGWTKLEMGLTAPKLRSGRLLLDFRAARYDYNSLTFYGEGPDSNKEGRSNYRLQDTSFDALAGLQVFKGIMVGTSGGYQSARVRSGEDQRYASTDTIYPDAVQAFGEHTDFLRLGAFAQADTRDNPLGPRRGHFYSARFDDYRARSSRPYSFQRVDIDVQQYLPLRSPRRVLALRARTIQSFTRGGNTVPFFQQAVLGGSDDLRGFRPYRFQDDNMFVANAEYRWEVFSGLDMAVFGDAGRVSPKRWDFRVSDLETTAGFGLRFNARNATFLRVDVGFSHEGFQVFVKFNNVFRERRPGSSSASHIF